MAAVVVPVQSGTGEISLTIPDQHKKPSSPIPAKEDVRSGELWTVELEATVHAVTNLNRGKSKDAGWTMACKFVFLNATANGESFKTQVTSLSQSVDRSVSLNLEIRSYQDIDELIHLPLLVNFYECVVFPPKDKKKPGEEKLELIGQTSVDMLPFLTGQTEIQGSWTIFPTGPPSPDGTFLGWDNPDSPQCSMTVKSSGPLIPSSFENPFNVFSLAIHSCYSVPETWIPPALTSHGASKNAPPTTGFTFATAVPKSGSDERPLVSTNRPILARPNLKNPYVKWPAHPLIVTDAIFMRKKLCEKKYLEETGNLCEPADWMHRDTIERVGPCIAVNTEFRCILPAEGEEAFRAKAMSRQVWPVEIFELVVPEKHPGGKKKGAADPSINPEEPIINRHGVAYVNTKPLFYPGATRIQGAYFVKAYDSLEFSDRTHRNSLGVEIAKMSLNPSGKSVADKNGRLSVGTARNRGDGGDRNLKSPEPSVAGAYPYKSSTDIPHGTINLGDQKRYEDTRAYIYLEIRLDKPLVKSSPTKPIIENVKQLITPKDFAAGSKAWEGSEAEKALEKFMEELFHHLAKVYRKETNESLSSPYLAPEQTTKNEADSAQLASRVKSLLTKTGDFHALKEHLKLHVMMLVRDKYGCIKAVDNVLEFERLLSTLYNDLMLYARLAFSRVKRQSIQRPLDISTAHSVSQLRIFALEAEIDENFTKAEAFMRKRTEIAPKDLTVWKDLGQFYVRHAELAKAQPAFMEMLADNYSNFEGLLLMGDLYFRREDYENATAFFEAVTILYPASGLAWTALGLFYQCLPSDPTGKRPVLVEKAYAEAQKAVGLSDKKAGLYQEFLQIREEQRASEVPVSADPNKLKPSSPIDQALRPKTGSDFKMASTKQIPKREGKAGGSLALPSEAEKTKEPKQEPLFNHLSFVSPPKPEHRIPLDNIFWCALGSFASLGMHLLTNKCVENLLKSCDYLDPVFWRAAVLSFLEQRRLSEAEQFLNRVMLSDVETADVFALLGHIKYIQENYKEAAANYRRALSLITEISDPYQVYFRYGRLSQKYRHHKKAKEMYLVAAKLQGTPENWLGAGWACYYLEDYENCELTLQEANYLDNKDPRIWAYLALLNFRLERETIARRCYSAARIFGVSDFPEVLQELKKTVDQLDDETGFLK